MEKHIDTLQLLKKNIKTKHKLIKDSFRRENDLKRAILKNTSFQALEFIDDQINLNYYSRILLSTNEATYFDEANIDNLRAAISLKKINHVGDINNYLIAMQKLLPDTGILVGVCETYEQRNIKIEKKFKRFSKLLKLFDFTFNRIIPRLNFFDKIYNTVTQNKIHLVSKAEMLGRLVYCGFDILDYQEIDNQLYFVAMNTHAPMTDIKPTYGPLVRLRRVGKNGKIIGVYKMRTMHPYSEFIQDFIVKLNGYNDVGKPANDFRVTPWGKLFRKLWLDEFPQVLNLLKGEMKLVGVRPLSKYRFSELPDEVQKQRILHKPGCFPPYVALRMPNSEGNIEAEIIYMKDKAANPRSTDIKYLLKSVYNILTNKIRSS